LLADRLIEIDAMQELLAKKRRRLSAGREAVVFLQTKEASARRSCQLIFLARSTCQYRIKREPDEACSNQVKELAFAHPRYGYWRIHALLKRSGQRVNEKRVARVWQKFGLQGARDGEAKETPKGARQPPMPQASRPNEAWTDDFMFDRDAAGGRLKLLTLMDEFTRLRLGKAQAFLGADDGLELGPLALEPLLALDLLNFYLVGEASTPNRLDDSPPTFI
jgi:hypothetical protein